MSEPLQPVVLLVAPDGRMRCLYDESIDLAVLGKLTISRASHVEPTDCGGWIADLSPVDGPVLGPFSRRDAALRAERAWIVQYRLSGD